MSAYIATVFTKDGRTETAQSWGEHYELLWEGWTPGDGAPANPAFGQDQIDAIAAVILDNLPKTLGGGNLVPNPNFSDGLTGYVAGSGTTLTLDDVNGIIGPAAGAISRGSSGPVSVSTPKIKVKPGVAYSGLAWSRLLTLGRTSATTATLTLTWYDAADAVISSVSSSDAPESIQGTWAPVTKVGVSAPDNVDSCVLTLSIASANPAEKHLVSGFSLQSGSGPLTMAGFFAASTLTGSMLTPASITAREVAPGSAKPAYGLGSARPAASGSKLMYVSTDTGAVAIDTGTWMPFGGGSGDSSPTSPQATDFGTKAWTFDPMLIGSNVAQGPSVGVLHLQQIFLRSDQTISNILVGVVAAGATVGATYLGLYKPDGTRVATSVDVSSAMTSTGLKTVALATPYVATAGTYYVGFLTASAATTPKFGVGPSGGNTAAFQDLANLGASAPYRSSTIGSGQSSLPASFTAGSTTKDSRAWWFGLS